MTETIKDAALSYAEALISYYKVIGTIAEQYAYDEVNRTNEWLKTVVRESIVTT